MYVRAIHIFIYFNIFTFDTKETVHTLQSIASEMEKNNIKKAINNFARDRRVIGNW